MKILRRYINAPNPILRYICETIYHEFQLHVSPHFSFMEYLDVDWVVVPSTYRYYIFLGDNIISWLSMCHGVICRSIIEAKYQVWHMKFMTRVRFKIVYVSFDFYLPRQPLFIIIKFVLCICSQIHDTSTLIISR